LDIAGFAGSLQTFSACTSLHKHWQENCENTDASMHVRWYLEAALPGPRLKQAPQSGYIA